jgi:hypothetical protein
VLAGSFQSRKQAAMVASSAATAAARKASNSIRPLTSTSSPESSGTPATLGDASVNPTGAAAAAPFQTKSSSSGDEDADAFRLELEKLQVETIYSLVEKIELPSGKLNMLFLTNDQARQFDFTDIDKVTRAMDINPKPKLIININKSPNSLGATTYHDCCGISGCPGAAFTDSLYVAEPDNAHLVETNQKMAMFLKEHLLPVCIKTNAVVFIHNDTCAISTIFGAICKAEQSRRHGKLPFTVCSVSGGHSVVMKAEYTPESIAYKICHGSRRWGQHKAEMLALFKTETLLDMPNNDFTGEISRE